MFPRSPQLALGAAARARARAARGRAAGAGADAAQARYQPASLGELFVRVCKNVFICTYALGQKIYEKTLLRLLMISRQREIGLVISRAWRAPR